MESSRRTFLQIAGVSVLGGIGGKWAVDAFAGAQKDPATTPLPNALTAKRWAMVVHTRKCLQHKDCKDCVLACHQAHNVPEFPKLKGELKKRHEIKWIWKEDYEGSFPNQHHPYLDATLKDQHLLVLCNHCDNPPCVRVCPTQATFRRESDGIVMMDQHRCIGCRYCMAACPYGSRSFNWREPWPDKKREKLPTPSFPLRTKGVVEKCNFCAERLARGERPSCVLACKHGALVFGDLSDPDSEVRKLLRSNYTIRRKPALGTRPQVFYIV